MTEPWPGPDRPPRVGLRLSLKALLGGLLITLCTSAAIATAIQLQVDELVEVINETPPAVFAKDTLQAPKPGEPQTLLVVGTDRRYGAGKGDARSDTMMLVRLNARAEAISVLNIPRDLITEIPGHGRTKINDAYALGGLDLVAQTVTALTGKKPSHALAVDFKGFRRVVDKLGCVYTDVDRRYFHSNAGLPPSLRYAEIDLQPGYQRLCGRKALDFVRFRYGDSDFVRAARQQGFLRQAKDQIGTSKLIEERNALVRIFGRSTQTDPGLHTSKQVLRLIEQGVLSAGKPVRQVKFPGELGLDEADGGLGSYVFASQEAIDRTVRRFFEVTGRQKAVKRPQIVVDGRRRAARGKRTTLADFGLRGARREGETLVARVAGRARAAGLPVYFPAGLTKTGRYDRPEDSANPRLYTLRDRAGKPHRAYRIVVAENMIEGQYWGVQGTTWRRPPALTADGDELRLKGRTYKLLYDGKRLRTVAWRTPKAVYWVSNTLSNKLTNTEMLGIARSLTRLGAPSE